MSNLLVIYEIEDKASKVSNKKSFLVFEKWIYGIMKQYHDMAIDRVGHIQLFRLKDHY
jgi:hypothetical protein